MSGRASVGGSYGGVLHALLHRGVARVAVVLDSEFVVKVVRSDRAGGAMDGKGGGTLRFVAADPVAASTSG